MEAEDAVLVARARRGDVAALEFLVRRYLRPAYIVALSVVRSAADAEDVAQEALMGALHRLDQCREPDRFARWLFTAVRHRAFNCQHLFVARRLLRQHLANDLLQETKHG